MRDKFPGYYRPTEAEFADLWARALFVVDANVLLNLYRARSTAAMEFLGLLEAVADRLWLPHQAGLEYHENRLTVLRDRTRLVNDFHRSRAEAQGQLEDAVRRLRRHPGIDDEELLKRTSAFFADIDAVLAERRAAEPALFEHDVAGPDPILERVTSLFEGRVGDPYPAPRLGELHAEAKRRYAAKRPPGYEDVDKGEPRQYGDFVLWRQVLDRARADDGARPVILVTDDEKEDWWWRVSGKTLSPRPELVEEFWVEVGEAFFMYSSSRFAEEARRHLKQRVTNETVDEIAEAQRRVWSIAPRPAVRATEAARIAGISYRQLDYWARRGIVTPQVELEDGRLAYGRRDLIRLVLVREVLASGLPLQAALAAVAALADGPDVLEGWFVSVSSRAAHLVSPDDDPRELAKWGAGALFDLGRIEADVDAGLGL